MSDYPEHDKLTAVSDESQAVAAFLDSSGYTLCEWHEAGDNGEPRYVWTDGVDHDGNPGHADFMWEGTAAENPEFDEWEDGFHPVLGSINTILAKHYGIDLDVLEAEKRAMLGAIRQP